MNGPIGLDYTPLMRLIDLEELPPDEWRSLFDSVRVIERAALDQIAANAAET